MEGLNSGQPIEADEVFWERLTEETDRMISEHQSRMPHP
jgi:hypothetical protein